VPGIEQQAVRCAWAQAGRPDIMAHRMPPIEQSKFIN
jgi:hypothetical protein